MKKLEINSFTTLTIFDFGKNWYWPLKQMAFAKKNFNKNNDLEFIKVMGTGGSPGFSLKPDFSKYAILCVLCDFMRTEKTRSAIPSNFAVVARRDLCSEAQS